MKAKLLTIVIALFALCGVAAAQDYYVVTTGRVVLKDAPDRYTTPTEYVPVSTILHVVGEQGEFLTIDRHGAIVWLDNRPEWRAFRRVENRPGLQALSQSPVVDNCCQIGWNCNTNGDWERGHAAYQEALCGEAVEIDNCCWLGWSCNTYDDWQRGYDAYLYDRTCSAPISHTQVSSQPVSTSGSVTAEPGDSVTVTYKTNLRTSYSLQSRVVSTVAGGTTFGVLGSHENWLKVAWGGREVWLAGWVPMTRVAGEPASPSIDNCCFVNRQCQTDQEWVDGYWAYQRNECGGPAPSAPDAEMPVKIEGSRYFVSLMRSAFDLLKQKSPYYYNYAISGLDRIVQTRQDGDPGQFGGEVLCEGERTYYSDRWDRFIFEFHRDLVYEAAIIVHEACHCHLGDVGEVPCYEQQMLAAYEIDPDNRSNVGWEHRKVVQYHLNEDPSLASLLVKPASFYFNF